MRIPVIRGIIDRRILVNYRADPSGDESDHAVGVESVTK